MKSDDSAQPNAPASPVDLGDKTSEYAAHTRAYVQAQMAAGRAHTNAKIAEFHGFSQAVIHTHSTPHRSDTMNASQFFKEKQREHAAWLESTRPVTQPHAAQTPLPPGAALTSMQALELLDHRFAQSARDAACALAEQSARAQALLAQSAEADDPGGGMVIEGESQPVPKGEA